MAKQSRSLEGLVDTSRTLVNVTSWSMMGHEALLYLEAGDLEGLRIEARYFITKEKTARKALGFVFKKTFEELEVEEQKKQILAVCDKRILYNKIYYRYINEDPLEEDHQKKLDKALKYDELIRKEGLGIFGCKSFVESVKDERRKKPPETIRPKTRKELQLEKDMSSVLGSRVYAFITNKAGEGEIRFFRKYKEKDSEKEISLTVRGFSDLSETLLDFLFDKHAKRDRAKMLKADTRDIISYVEVAEKLSRIEETGIKRYGLEFTATELREKLGIRITDKEIDSALNALRWTDIKLEGKKIWFDKDKKRFGEITLETSILDTIIIEKSGKTLPRTGEDQLRFGVYFGLGWGMIFENEILNKRYSCFPKKFYKISAGARKLGRYLSCFGKSVLTISIASSILGYKADVKNLPKRKRNIESKLDELIAIRFIDFWGRATKDGKEKTGKNTAWNISLKR